MIGIYGGTFDPIHFGHLRAALEVFQSLNLTQMRMIPCQSPPHRDTPNVSAEQRLALLQLAIADLPGFIADRRELDRSGPSYTVDTLRSLRNEFADTALLLCMGYDAFAGIERWHCWQQLFDLAHVLVITRPGFERAPLNTFLQSRLQPLEQLPGSLNGGLSFFETTALDISATAIRRCFAQRRSPRFLLPDSVIHAIQQQQLYLS